MIEKVEDSFKTAEHKKEDDKVTGKRPHSHPKEVLHNEKKTKFKPLQEATKYSQSSKSSSMSITLCSHILVGMYACMLHMAYIFPLDKNLWLEETGLKPEAAYRFDKKPDAENLAYNTLYRSHVANYRRCSLFCVGQSDKQEFAWDDGRNIKSLKQKNKKNSRYFTSRLISSRDVLSFAQILGQISEKVTQEEDSEEFIEISDVDRGHKDDEPSLTVESYIAQKTAEFNRGLSQNPHNIDLWLSFIEFQEKCILWGVSPEGTISSSENPQDFSTTSEKRRLRLALIDRKIAIFEKALEKNPMDTQLILGHMKLCEEIWERERIVKRWKDIVFRQPQNTDLWLGYLSYCQMHYSSFSTSSLLNLYAKALSTLVSIVEGRLVSHKPREDTEEAMLCMFLNLCYFLHYVGHAEKALANLQALIEFNFQCPEELDVPHITLKDKIEFFEPFWDSNVPRIGEQNARGWKRWFEERKKEKTGELNQTEQCGFLESVSYPEENLHKLLEEETALEMSLIGNKPLHVAWAHLEEFREQEHFLPWHLSAPDEEEPEDVDRVVLFDDISSFLFHVKKESSQISLLATFLHFIGSCMPPYPVALLSPDWISARILTTSQILGFGNQLCGVMPFSADITCPEYQYQSLTFGTCLQSLENEAGCLNASISFIRSSFNQVLSLVPPVSVSHFACWWLFFEYSHISSQHVTSQEMPDRKVSKKYKQSVKRFENFAKTLLRHPKCRNDVPLWCVYAVLKAACGDREAAVKVMETVLVQASQGSDPTGGLLQAVTTYVGLLLGTALSPIVLQFPGLSSFMRVQTGEEELLKAKHALISLAEGKFVQFSPDRVTSTLVLRTEKRLKENAQRAISSIESDKNVNEVSLRVVSCAQFLYVNSGLRWACCFLEEVQDYFKGICTVDRTTYQNKMAALLAQTIATEIQLLHHHSERNPDPPSLMRAALLKGISCFPESPYFLTLFSSFEGHSMVVGKVREYYNENLPKARTAIPWLVALAFEESRQNLLRQRDVSIVQLEELEMGVAHRIRSLYLRATQHTSGRHCPLLWRRYMTFEVLEYMLLVRAVLSVQYYVLHILSLYICQFTSCHCTYVNLHPVTVHMSPYTLHPVTVHMLPYILSLYNISL